MPELRIADATLPVMRSICYFDAVCVVAQPKGLA